jgi:8-oxo-dGTP diphosphatase
VQSSPSDGARRRILVVAGLIGARGRVLLTRRRADQEHPLEWELPGGKIEPGEAPAAALARELAEEIGVEVAIGPVWEVLHHIYPQVEVVMLVYPCRLIGSSAPRAIEVAELAWYAIDALADVAILPADAPLVARLAREGLPGFLTDG